MTRIREISALETYPLRRQVLRGGNLSADVHFAQDDDPAAFHLGVEVDGALVGIASFSPAETPYRSGVRAWQLRAMAITPPHQGMGLGAAIIAEAVARLAAEGARVLWCNARDTATGFYERLGFSVHGDGFVTADSGVAHHVMVLDL